MNDCDNEARTADAAGALGVLELVDMTSAIHEPVHTLSQCAFRALWATRDLSNDACTREWFSVLAQHL